MHEVLHTAIPQEIAVQAFVERSSGFNLYDSVGRLGSLCHSETLRIFEVWKSNKKQSKALKGH